MDDGHEPDVRDAASLLIGTLITGGLGMGIGSAISSRKGRGAAYGALVGSAVGATFLGTTMLGLICGPWKAASGVPGSLSGAHQYSPLFGERITSIPRT